MKSFLSRWLVRLLLGEGIRILTVGETDMVVLECDRALSHEEMQRISESWNTLSGGIKAIVFSGGISATGVRSASDFSVHIEGSRVAEAEAMQRVAERQRNAFRGSAL